MEKSFYDAESLERALRSFEDRYGMASEEVYRAREAGERLEAIPRFHQHVWMSFYRDVERLRQGDFAGRAVRALELA